MGENVPRQGYKSITVTQKVYDFFRQEYEKKKDKLAVHGVRSFSGYVTMRLAQLLEQEKKHSP